MLFRVIQQNGILNNSKKLSPTGWIGIKNSNTTGKYSIWANIRWYMLGQLPKFSWILWNMLNYGEQINENDSYSMGMLWKKTRHATNLKLDAVYKYWGKKSNIIFEKYDISNIILLEKEWKIKLPIS